MSYETMQLFGSILSSLIIGAGSAYVTFRLQFESHRAMDKQREKDWVEWRREVNARLNDLEENSVTHEIVSQMHEENRDSLSRIERLIERNADEAKQDRHAINNRMMELVTRISVEEKRAK